MQHRNAAVKNSQRGNCGDNFRHFLVVNPLHTFAQNLTDVYHIVEY